MFRRLPVAMFIALVFSPTLHAHHSFAAEFSYELTGTITGEVIEVLYVNPHARYFVAVIDDEGNEVIWDAQSRSPSALTRANWTRDTLKVGDRVTLEGNLGRDNTRKIWIREARLESGQVVYPYAADAEQVEEEGDEE